MYKEYIFEIRGSLAPRLRDQAAALAAAVPEGYSRRACPGLWKLTDLISSRARVEHGSGTKNYGIQTVLGIILLLLSIVSLGPALLDREELLTLLLVGIVALAAGARSLWSRHRGLLCGVLMVSGLFYSIGGLFGGAQFRMLLVLGLLLLIFGILTMVSWRKNKKKLYQKEGSDLLAARNSISVDNCLRVCFSEKGMQFRSIKEVSPWMPYSDFICVIESRDLILMLGTEGKAFLLGKDELKECPFVAFRQDLSEKLTWIYASGSDDHRDRYTVKG